VLRPDWRTHRVPIHGPWGELSLYRLGDLDLFLSKLMRDDPVDQTDARFIVERACLSQNQIREAIRSARVPDDADVREQFARCFAKFLQPL